VCLRGGDCTLSFFLRDFLPHFSYLDVMHIIPVTGNAIIIFLPFNEVVAPLYIYLTDENTNESVLTGGYSLGLWSVDNNYWSLIMNWSSGTGNLTRKEGNYYTIEMRNQASNALVYRGQIYATQTPSADLPKYSLNTNAYIEQAGNNEFIVL
jgi:hypothetical protein